MGDLAMGKQGNYISNRYRTSLDDKVRVCFYGRVSTQHEAQMNALENQMQWYDNILSFHPNWEKVEVYVDRGVTGTQAKKRKGFMRMIEDASEGRFDIICTREVSRFARNTVDSQNYTRQLRKIGVEVFFYNDNIWSFEADGEMRLTIMSAMSQEESRHISDRVRAGQSVSRKKNVLYGNGNILGYRLVKGATSSENTYEIVEEDAETVRMICDYYLEGMGVKSIAVRMQELHRQTAKVGCKWDATKILRILDNKTYAGYIGYNKSHTTSFLEHTRVAVKDRSQYEYVKGNFPAIIPEETWDRVQSLKAKKVTYIGDGKYGKQRSKDRWIRVLVCECGKTYHKYKWRENKLTGEKVYGYKCWNQVNNGKKSLRIENGLDAEGYCNVPCICEWKLDLMLKNILQRIWSNPKETVTILTESIAENFVEEQNDNTEHGILQREYDRLKCRLERLLDMRLDNGIDEKAFEEKKNQLGGRMAEIEAELKNHEQHDIIESIEDVGHVSERVRHVLNSIVNLEQKAVDDRLVDTLVERVTPTEAGVFKWYLNCSTDEDTLFAEKDHILYDSFSLGFDEARTYRKKSGNFIRPNQWKDLQVEVYIKR